MTKEHGGCLRDLGRREEVEAALLSAHELLARVVGAKDQRTQKVVGELIALYEGWERPEDVARWVAKRTTAPK